MRWPGPLQAGPPVVLVHGLGMSSRYMLRAGTLLSRTVPVWAPDLPGFGRTPADRVLTITELADALQRWCERLDLPAAVFVGHSFGCQVAVELGTRRPEQVAGLVLAAPTVDPAARTSLRQIGRVVRDIFREPFSLAPVVATEYLRAGLPRVLRTLHFMMRDPIEQKLPTLTMPSLVLQGERDRVVPPAWSQAVARLLPRGRYAVIGGAAHGLNFSRPAAFAAAIEDFITG